MKKSMRFILSAAFLCCSIQLSACSAGSIYPADTEKQEKETEASIFQELPAAFWFSSGVGAWQTELHIFEDGAFSGEYHDSDMGDQGEGYPNGTVYICGFSGKFSQPRKVDEHTYSMELESLEAEGTPGDIYFEDQTRYIYSEPYGLDNAGEFLLYLPGTQVSSLPEGFLNWAGLEAGTEALPPDFYGLYNVNAEEGFVGISDSIR